ncbi:MAG TPA: hypothetical protein VIR64_06215, partial [Pseudobacillus sp.]
MSLFKRIIGLFREEIDEEVEQSVKPFEQEELLSQRTDEQPVSYLLHERQPETQEMKTKITYRYPSRELQAPGRETAQPRRERRVRLERQESPEDSQEQEYHHIKKEEQRSKQPIKSLSTYKPSPGPFRPTEIPSPIYGFNKRPKNKVTNIEESHGKVEVTPVTTKEKWIPSAAKEKVDLEPAIVGKEEKVNLEPAIVDKEEKVDLEPVII